MVVDKLGPLIDALADYGKAFDVISNSFSFYICPVRGAVRIVVTTFKNHSQYQETVVNILQKVGDILPRSRAYQAKSLTDAHLVVL